jgi:glyoxylase-like metal-dependent hydrolase (beta-lactamase superfamily II)
MNNNRNNAEKPATPSGGWGIHTFVFNPVQENTYLIWDETGECAIVDAGCFNQREFEKLDGFIKSKNLKPVKLINTHCHFDHIFGIEQCRKAYGLKWEAHYGDNSWVEGVQQKALMFGIQVQPIPLPEIELNDGDEVLFGNSTLKIFHVPGHSPGSICFYNEESKVLITGDVLFNGSIGRTDLQGGDFDTLISGIKSKLLVLPDDVDVFPGHGPATTIGDEKATNPFLQ